MPNFYIFFGILGLIFGSFFNVLIYRVPTILEANLKNPSNKQSFLKKISYPSSHCPVCKNTLRWFDNIPLVSWIILGGKCRYCKTDISFLYFIGCTKPIYSSPSFIEIINKKENEEAKETTD